MLQGIQIKLLKRKFDERGFFTELMRRDWRELLGEDEIVQANLSISYPELIRAWHRHLRGQVDYSVVLKGAIKICASTRTHASWMKYCQPDMIFKLLRFQEYAGTASK